MSKPRIKFYGIWEGEYKPGHPEADKDGYVEFEDMPNNMGQDRRSIEELALAFSKNEPQNIYTVNDAEFEEIPINFKGGEVWCPEGYELVKSHKTNRGKSTVRSFCRKRRNE